MNPILLLTLKFIEFLAKTSSLSVLVYQQKLVVVNIDSIENILYDTLLSLNPERGFKVCSFFSMTGCQMGIMLVPNTTRPSYQRRLVATPSKQEVVMNNHSNHSNGTPRIGHAAIAQRPWNPPQQFFGEPEVRIFFARPVEETLAVERAETLDAFREHDGTEFVVPPKKDTTNDRFVFVMLRNPTTENSEGERYFRLPQTLLMSEVQRVGIVQIAIAEEYWFDKDKNEHLVLVGDSQGNPLLWEQAVTKRPRTQLNDPGVRVLFRIDVTEGQSNTISVLHIIKCANGIGASSKRPGMVIHSYTLRVSVTRDGIKILEKNLNNPIADFPGFGGMLETAIDKLRDNDFHRFYLMPPATPLSGGAPPQATPSTITPSQQRAVSTNEASVPPSGPAAPVSSPPNGTRSPRTPPTKPPADSRPRFSDVGHKSRKQRLFDTLNTPDGQAQTAEVDDSIGNR
jgi:hypothetical protein